MDFHSLKRRRLQRLCKKNKVPANMTNKAMADALDSLNSVKRKFKSVKEDEEMNLRKKSMSKACGIIESTQEKEKIVPLSKDIEGRLNIPDSFPTETVLNTIISSDIIFTILSLLPTESILRMKSVCRAWADIIADSAFIRAHLSRPFPLTSFLIRRNAEPPHVFEPLQRSPKFPSMITSFLSNGFVAASTSHGLICFDRGKDEVTIVANPATSHWTLIPRLETFSRSARDYVIRASQLIIYDPIKSPHFRLAVAARNCKNQVRFFIYSSETSSWAISSFRPHGDNIFIFLWPNSCIESRIGGGSVCWKGSYNLMGYEIASDTYWMTSLPAYVDDARCLGQCRLLGQDGEVYCVVFHYKTVNVQRLDEKKNWVLEVECYFMELKKLLPYFSDSSRMVYDGVRKVLFISMPKRNELIVFHLSSSRIEVIGEDNQVDCHCHQITLAHTDTLASFYGGRRDNYALEKLLH